MWQKPFLNETWEHVLILPLWSISSISTVSFIIIGGGVGGGIGCVGKFSPLDDKKKFSTSNQKDFVKKKKCQSNQILREKNSEIAIFR